MTARPQPSSWLPLVLLALAGCAPVAHTPPQPAADLMTARWPADAPTPASAAAAPDWPQFAADPVLRQLLEQSLAHNRDLRLALLRIEEARAAHGLQASASWPSIGLGASAARARVPGDLNISGRSVVSGEYQAFVGLSSWELDLWGRVRSLNEAALRQYLASDAAAQAVRTSLLAQVASSYLQLKALDERLNLAEQTLVSRRDSLRIFTRRAEVGSASRLELMQVRTLLTQAESLAAQLAQSRAQLAHALAQLVGTPVDLPHQSGTRVSGDELGTGPEPGLPSELLQRRPDIVAAEHQLQAAHANVAAARAAFFPRIALTGSWGTSSAALDGLFASGSRAWSFMPQINLPLFDGGARQAQLDLGQARQHLAVAEYEKTVQTAFREVADALSLRHWSREQVRIQQDSVAAQTERARLAGLRYDAGSSTYLEVQDAQRSLLDAQQQLVQARLAQLDAQVQLFAALGGAPWSPLAPAAPL